VSRRAILAGLVTVAAGGIGGTGARALALPTNDARLLELARELAKAWKRDAEWSAVEDAACTSGDTAAGAQADTARNSAWDDVVRLHTAIAALPAFGLAGIAVKVAVVAKAIEPGFSPAESAVGNSLRTDLARLVPGVAS